MEQLNLGQIIITPQQRDAIHIAVAPVVAADKLRAGDKVWLENGLARLGAINSIGVVDPFLDVAVEVGQTFWLYLNPGSITSLRHDWTHPAFEAAAPAQVPQRSASEKWMREWAMKHVSEDYYGDSGRLSEDDALAYAIDVGHRNHIGPHEDARAFIDDEWWTHWEAITGKTGSRGEYFSCSC